VRRHFLVQDLDLSKLFQGGGGGDGAAPGQGSPPGFPSPQALQRIVHQALRNLKESEPQQQGGGGGGGGGEGGEGAAGVPPPALVSHWR
jgi:hypothetical protein